MKYERLLALWLTKVENFVAKSPVRLFLIALCVLVFCATCVQFTGIPETTMHNLSLPKGG